MCVLADEPTKPDKGIKKREGKKDRKGARFLSKYSEHSTKKR